MTSIAARLSEKIFDIGRIRDAPGDEQPDDADTGKGLAQHRGHGAVPISYSYVLEGDPYGDRRNAELGYPRDEGQPVPGRRPRAEHRVIVDRTARAENVLEIAKRVASIGLVWPAELLRHGLTEFFHIGPIREIPPRSFAGRANVVHTRWIDGLAAWDVLSHADSALVDRVNGWLTRQNRLNTGYELRVVRFREIPLDDPLSFVIQGADLEAVFPDEADYNSHLAALPIRTRLFLRREGSLTDLSPADVGVGLSQLVPIVVVALHAKGALIAVEQPELHNHPALQVALGDLFIEAAFPKLPDLNEVISEKISQTYQNYKPEQRERLQEGLSKDAQYLQFETQSESEKRESERVCFLIETHSEHLILRLLRRIRETAKGELPPGAPALKPDDIAVHYVEPTADSVRIQRLRVNDKGDFVDRWPRGFFEERGDELFS